MTYTNEDINNWPADSYAGRERDLADMLDDGTMAYLDLIAQDDADKEQLIWHLFNLLMIHEPAFLAMTRASEIDAETRSAMRDKIQEDANESTGMYFELRVNQRLEMRERLYKLTADARAHGMTD